MGRLRAHGVGFELPGGWEGQIRPCAEDPAAFATATAAEPVTEEAAVGAAGDVVLAAAEAPPQAAAEPATRVVAHLANFALPAERGDFGGGAVELMGPRHVFVALVEFNRADAGSALFARQGIPRRLRTSDFHPEALQRTIQGQAGCQTFFSEHGRAFCLYVVLGSHRLAGVTVPAVNDILADLEID